MFASASVGHNSPDVLVKLPLADSGVSAPLCTWCGTFSGDPPDRVGHDNCRSRGVFVQWDGMKLSPIGNCFGAYPAE